MTGRRQPTVRMPLAATALAYLAGLFDGEGSIIKHSPPPSRGRPVWRITITGTSPELREFLAPLGGQFYRKVRYSPRHAEAYNWTLERQADCQIFLEAVLPYLHLKRGRAFDALADLLEKWGDIVRLEMRA